MSKRNTYYSNFLHWGDKTRYGTQDPAACQQLLSNLREMPRGLYLVYKLLETSSTPESHLTTSIPQVQITFPHRTSS